MLLPINITELQGARESMEDLLTSTCTVTRFIFTNDSEGGQERTPTTLGPFKCRLVFKSGDIKGRFAEEQIAAKIKANTSPVLYVPAGTDIRLSDRIVVNSITYEVLGFTSENTDSFLDSWTIQVAP